MENKGKIEMGSRGASDRSRGKRDRQLTLKYDLELQASL